MYFSPIHQTDGRNNNYRQFWFIFTCSLGAIADLDLVVRSKGITSDIMVVSQQGISLQVLYNS